MSYIYNEHSTGPLHIPLHAIAGVFHPQPTPRQAIGKKFHFRQMPGNDSVPLTINH
jgi:hypothetical protein